MNVQQVNEAVSRDRMALAFVALDRNKDGQISARDIQMVFRKLGVKKTLASCKQILWFADEYSRGYLTLEDFVEVMERFVDCKRAYVAGDLSNEYFSEFFHLVEFVLLDTELTGYISVEDCLLLLCDKNSGSGPNNMTALADIRRIVSQSEEAPNLKISYIEYAKQIAVRKIISRH